MIIRKLNPNEYPAAMDLVQDVFNTFVGGDYAPEGRETFYSFLESVRKAAPGSYVLWGAFVEDTLAGVLAANPAYDHINLLFVHAGYHRRGIAAALYAELLAEANAAGVYAITVNASRHGLPAYRRLGFLETEGEVLRDGIRFTPMAHALQGFLLRPWRAEDAAAITPLASDPLVAENLRNVFPHPYTLSDAESYIADCLANADAALVRCIVVDGKPAGSIGVFPLSDVYAKSAEVGYWLGKPYWGRGIMSAAVRQICKEAFARYDIARIHAEVFSRNPASCRVLQKAGFTPEGVKRNSVYKNGVLMDSHIYALLREEL